MGSVAGFEVDALTAGESGRGGRVNRSFGWGRTCLICAIKPLEQTSKRRFCKVCSSDQRAMKLDAEFKEQDGKPDFLARFRFVVFLFAIAWFLVLVSQTSTLWFGYRFFQS